MKDSPQSKRRCDFHCIDKDLKEFTSGLSPFCSRIMLDDPEVYPAES